MSTARPPTIAVTVLYFAAAATETGLTAEVVELPAHAPSPLSSPAERGPADRGLEAGADAAGQANSNSQSPRSAHVVGPGDST